MLQHSCKLSSVHSIKTNYSPSVYLDSTRKNPLRRTLVKLRIQQVATTYALKQVGLTKSLSMKEYVLSVVVIKLRTKAISFSIE